MNKDIKKVENKLQEVLEKNEDAVKGFEKAAENAKETSTKSYFTRRATGYPGPGIIPSEPRTFYTTLQIKL